MPMRIEHDTSIEACPEIRKVETRHVRAAARSHRCSVCGTDIPAGTPHERYAFIDETNGQFRSARAHLHCPV